MSITNMTYNGRYQLHNPLGQGGMGVVYRATDRLNGATVALKQIVLASDSPATFTSSHTKSDLRLALAHEFQTLASLRHPNIISVLDYGFYTGPNGLGELTELPKPFFTMSYLANAQTILDAGAELSTKGRIRLLQQMLEALAYLHRRGILHRDLKPENVLVTEQTLRLLDFGLSSARGNKGSSVGTWAYLAPELLENKRPTPAIDLYAVGVLAYQLFAGRHPFDPTSHEFIDQLLDAPPDLTRLQANDKLKAVIGKLLSKEPTARYPDATATIAAFRAAIGKPAVAENSSVRESYLQAATFVGRESEMTRLTTVLEQAQVGNGSVWLVGGESGVGKSRLLDEFRTRALVKGWQVLRGQAIYEGGAPYQLWRNIALHLALSINLSDLEASILKAITPKIEYLLGRPVPDPPKLSEKAAQQRLILTLVNILQRQTQPTLLFLEDLHWASESLIPIQYLARLLTHEQLVVIGTYRDDESPNLPQEIPEAEVLPLARLDKSAIAELSSAMLGDAVGQRAEVVQLLHQETEGNAFFLVEVVRALAEEAGSMADVITMSLPERVLTGGIQKIVRRRLAKVAPHHQPLLKLTAVAGRDIDLTILEQLQINDNTDAWLIAGQEAGVLAVQENRWQFAHDKLRQAVLTDLTITERLTAHQTVAEAIEQAYPDDPVQASSLAQHWESANHLEKAQRYAFIAGKYAAKQYANKDAIILLSRAFSLAAEGDLRAQYDCLLAREAVNKLLGKRDLQQQDLIRLTALADEMDQPGLQAKVALRQASYLQIVGDFNTAVSTARRAIELAEVANDPLQIITGKLKLGTIFNLLGESTEAQKYLDQCLTGYRELDDPYGEGQTLLTLGRMLRSLGKYDQAHALLEQGLTISQQIGNRALELYILNNLGISLDIQRKATQAQSTYAQCLIVNQEVGDRLTEGAILLNLGLVARTLMKFEMAQSYFEQSEIILREVNDFYGEGLLNGNWGGLVFYFGQYDKANDYFSKALAIFQEIGSRGDEYWILLFMGEIAQLKDNYELAQIYFEQVLVIVKEIKNQYGTGLVYDALGWLAYAQGSYDEAYDFFQRAIIIARELDFPTIDNQVGLIQVVLAQGGDYTLHLEAVLGFLKESDNIYRSERPFRAFLVCYHGLHQLEDVRAEGILKQAYTLLQGHATQIKDVETRHSFLENVVENREIINLVDQL